VADLQVVVSHHDRVVVRVGDIFLKIDASSAKTDLERRAMTAGAATVPVAAIEWCEPHVLALARVHGRPLDDDCSSAAWRSAGAAARAIHESPAPHGIRNVFVGADSLRWLTADREWFVAHPSVLDLDVFDRHHAVAVAGLEGRDVESVFLHGDLQAAHVFVDGDDVTGIIDWADVSLDDPRFDLAVLTGGHPHRLDDVLAGYGEDRDVDRDVIAGWWSLRWLGEIRWMVEHGYDVTAKVAAVTALVGGR